MYHSFSLKLEELWVEIVVGQHRRSLPVHKYAAILKGSTILVCYNWVWYSFYVCCARKQDIVHSLVEVSLYDTNLCQLSYSFTIVWFDMYIRQEKNHYCLSFQNLSLVNLLLKLTFQFLPTCPLLQNYLMKTLLILNAFLFGCMKVLLQRKMLFDSIIKELY